MTSTTHSTKTVSKTPKKPTPDGSGAFVRLLGYLKPHLVQVIVIGLLIVLVNLTTLLKPWFIKIITDEYLVARRLVSSQGLPLWGMALIYMAIMILGMAAFYFQVLLITKVGQLVARRLRETVFTSIQLFPLSYLDKTSAGRLITRTTNDVEAVSELFTDILVSLVKDVILLAGVIFAMLQMNVELTLWSLIVLPPMLFVIFYIRKMIHDNWIELKAITSRLNGFIAENISGMKIVQLFNGKKEKFEGFSYLNNEYFRRSLIQLKMHSLSGPSANVFESLATAVILIVGMNMLRRGSVNLGDVIALTLYVRQFFAPLADLAESFTQIESALVSATRIFEITDQTAILEDLDRGQELQGMKGDIEFRNVWFAYEGENWILKDVSFHVRPGETFAIIGETGSGKTTIISLLSGFYDIQKGQILIDGIDIREIRKRDLRRQVAVVLQDVFLFSGTIRENITLNDSIPQERIEDAIDKSHARPMIDQFSQGLEEPVMERGATLSMGQRQLLSFARALAHDPAIFVLDEATANIDTKTEILIQQAIETISQERTTIIIAHRLSTIRNADLILVLADGRIIEQGSHDQLMATASVYRTMVEKGSSLAS
ncbi:putative ABC transporter ATP-binding protein [anaerobic digester metagenome]